MPSRFAGELGATIGAVSVMEFVASIVSAVAWPAVVIVAMVAFGRHVRSWLSERPAKVKFGLLEAEWVRQAAQAEASLEVVEARRPDDAEPNAAGLLDLLKPVVVGNPQGAVIGAAKELEHALRVKLASAGVQDFGGVGLGGLAALARKQGLVDDHTSMALYGLVVMRNLAVHGGSEVSAERALEYVSLADAVSRTLKLYPL